MKIKNKNRIIYDERYYKSQFLLRKQEFQDAILNFKRIFSGLGCQIPDKSFSSLSEFRKWNKELARKHIETLRKSPITEPYFPKWKDEINKILRQLNLDDGYFIFVWLHIFLGVNSYQRPLFEIYTQKSSDSDENELLLKIYPHTRREDIDINWPIIKQAQKTLLNYKARDKSIYFEKDLKIYNEYLEIKKFPLGERFQKYGERDIYEILAENNDLTSSGIEKIIKRIKDLLLK